MYNVNYIAGTPWQPILLSSMKSSTRSIRETTGTFACSGAATSMTMGTNRKTAIASYGAAPTGLFNLLAARRVSRHSPMQSS